MTNSLPSSPQEDCPQPKPTAESWEERHYRLIEAMFSDFKNKLVGYSEFIDRDKDFIRETLASQAAEYKREVEKVYQKGWKDACNKIIHDMNYDK